MENKTLYGVDDGMVMNDVGPWSPEKYGLTRLYCQFFTKGMKGKKWSALVYLDLYAGAGLSRICGTNEILLGSPLIALSVDVQFDQYVFCEQDAEKMNALQSRVNSMFPDAKVRFVTGDCNSPSFDIGTAIPKGALTLCFVDPYDLGIQFSTLRSLAKNRKMDFLCFIGTGDASRNPHNYPREDSFKVDDFLGTAEWREEWDQLGRGSSVKPNLGTFVRMKFAAQMETLGYLPTESHQMYAIKNGTGTTIYHLALFAKNNIAKHYWAQASRYSPPQKSLF